MMIKYIFYVLGFLVLVSCSDPKDTVIPHDLAQMESIKPMLQKLSPNERELAAAYISRHAVEGELGNIFGLQGKGIPVGMTIGGAIEEQRKINSASEGEKQK